ncbi:MAG: sensor domain-containing diguanylate cyclase [Thermodesulfovibrionales bacterium]|nr:sensor domain-containing diguanylate cyclase [Thermodesulfovibrionales bacterium]
MIYAYVKDRVMQSFLKSSLKEVKVETDFQLNKSYLEFFDDKDSFVCALKTRPPMLIILEDSLLNVLSREKLNGCSFLSIIGKDIKTGLKRISRYNIPFYILPPYRKEDLLYKINSAINIATEKHLLKAIIDISAKVTSTLDVFEILYHSVKKISEVILVSRCSIIKISSKAQHARVVATYEDPSIRDIKLDLRKYPEIQTALKTRQPVIIRDAQRDPLMQEVYSLISPLKIKSIIVIPIIYRDEAIGALFLRTSRKEKTFTPAEINFLQAVANSTANALYNAFLFDEIKQEKQRLERLSITDYLTGLYNNRYFFHRLEEEFEKAKRYNTPLSCIMIDLDFFKSINDEFGHKKGDGVLRELGKMLKKFTRKGDIIARYGGEEFIMLLPHTDMEGALKEAERLRLLISNLRFKDLKKKTITASFGIATWPSSIVKNSDDLVTYADNALYNAKKEGRNRVCIFKEQVSANQSL